MLINKEQYREFERKNMIYFRVPGKAEAAEAAEKGKDKGAEEQEKDVTSKSEEINTKRKLVNSLVEKMIREADASHKEAARNIGDKIKRHAQKRFNEMARQYDAARAKAELPLEDMRARYEKPATTLYENIEKRIEDKDVASTYLEHQGNQDLMESWENFKGPGDKAERIKAVKEYMVRLQLREHGISDQKVLDKLSQIIVKQNKIAIKGPDIDSYTNPEVFFAAVEKHQLSFKVNLEKQTKQIVNEFLGELPKVETRREEIDAVKDIILKTPSLYERFTTMDFINSAATAIAKRFDIQVRGGKVLYAIDLAHGEQANATDAKGFKKFITQLLLSDDFEDEGEVEDYSEDLDDDTEWLTERREEISKITTMSDWGKTEAPQELLAKTERAKQWGEHLEGKHERTEKIRAGEEATEKSEAERKAAWEKTLSEAGINEERLKGLNPVSKDKPSFNSYLPTKGTIELTNEKTKDKMTITVDLTNPDKPEIRISNISIFHEKIAGAESSYRDLSLVKTFSPSEFKKIDLNTYPRKREAIFQKNTAAHSEAAAAVNEINTPPVKGLKVDYPEWSTEEIQQDDYKVPNATLKYNDMTVGTIEFKTATEEGQKTTAIVKVAGQPDSKPMELSKLNNYVRWQAVPQMQKAERLAKSNEKEVNAKIDEDFRDYKEPAGLTWEAEVKMEGNFASKTDLIQVGTYDKGGKNVATLFIPASKDKNRKRQYVLKIGDTETRFDTVKDVNDHLTKEAEELAKLEAKAKAREEAGKPQEIVGKNPEEIKLRIDARDKVVSYLQKNYPDIKPPVSMDQNYDKDFFNRWMNKLDIKLIEKISKAENLDKVEVSKEEKDQIIEAGMASLREMVGASEINEVDPEEVKAINELQVTIKTKSGEKTQRFDQVFGKDLAKIISRTHEVKAIPTEADGLIITGPDGEPKTVFVTELGDYLPPTLRANYQKKLNGEEVEPKEWDGAIKRMNEGLDGYKTMEDAMEDPEVKKRLDQMTPGELLATFGTLLRLIKQAMKDGDFQPFLDAAADLKAGRNPQERMENASREYERIINETKDTGTLIELYNDPYHSPKAKKLFSEKKGESLPYRFQVKQLIEQRLASDLDVDISEMKKVSGKELKITCSKGAKRYTITLTNKDKKTFAKLEETLLHDDGTAYNETRIRGEEVRGTAKGDKNLAFVLFKMEGGPTASESREADEKPETIQGIKSGFTTLNEKGEMVINKKGGGVRLNQILEPDVEEISIKSKETGKVTTAYRDKKPDFKSDNNRLKIHEGDVIVGTKTENAS